MNLPAASEHRTGLVTLVFTDLVGSTALKQQIGDRQAVALMQRHHALVRELLADFVGAREKQLKTIDLSLYPPLSLFSPLGGE